MLRTCYMDIIHNNFKHKVHFDLSAQIDNIEYSHKYLDIQMREGSEPHVYNNQCLLKELLGQKKKKRQAESSCLK